VTRDPASIRADLADLERLLVDMPPHHAGGTRVSAREQLDELRAELRRAEAIAAGPPVDDLSTDRDRGDAGSAR
jgi:hypothetical protein